MRTDDPGRRFSREGKLAAVQRMAAGANVSRLLASWGFRTRAFISGKSSCNSGKRHQTQFTAGRTVTHCCLTKGVQSTMSQETVTYVSRMDPNSLGWGARIRTWECRYQKPVPYRLATPHHSLRAETRFAGSEA
jgi:hypothetical protein